ncbi:MAG: shikimate kinase [Bdellovibrionota bacterium]
MKKFYLIGFRGAGKTTLGQAIAAETREQFLDTDEIWEKRSGISINEFVEKNGIEAFRREEEKILRELDANATATWIATGGGVVEWDSSLNLLRASKREIIYVKVGAEEAWRRLKDSPERKKIGSLDSLGALSTLLEKRRPLYEEISTHTVENRVITETLARLKQLAV